MYVHAYCEAGFLLFARACECTLHCVEAGWATTGVTTKQGWLFCSVGPFCGLLMDVWQVWFTYAYGRVYVCVWYVRLS